MKWRNFDWKTAHTTPQVNANNGAFVCRAWVSSFGAFINTVCAWLSCSAEFRSFHRMLHDMCKRWSASCAYTSQMQWEQRLGRRRALASDGCSVGKYAKMCDKELLSWASMCVCVCT